MSKNEPSFQRYAFDAELNGKRGVDELHQFFGDEIAKPGFTSGFQIKRFRTGYQKEIPEWATTNEGIQKVLLRAFPRLHICPNQRQRAARWAHVIYLFYFKGFSQSQIAEELNTKTKNINNTILRVTLVSKGFRANGSGPRKNKSEVIGTSYGGSKRPSEPIAGDVPEGCQSLSSNLLVKETRGEDRA